MKRTKNTIRNIIWGIVNKFVILLFPFIIRTILIKKLGSEYLGLSSLFTSILQVLNLTELGFSGAIIFSMYKPIAQNDSKTICALLNLYKKIYRVIGIIILIIGIAIMPFLDKLINGTYPENINIYILYGIYLFNTVITYFLFAYKSALLTAHQRVDITSNVNTVMYIIQYCIQIVVLCVLKNYYIYILINTFTNILNNIVIAIITKRKYPQYICKGKINKQENKEIQKRVYGLMIQKICTTTRNSLDNIFISAFLGLNIVAIYSNYYSILSAITGILIIITDSMVAGVGNSIVTETIKKNYDDLTKFNFIYMWISGWCTICLLCLFQPFMELWMGKEYMFPLITVICFCIYFYALKIGDVLSTYKQASGIWWEGKYRAAAETVCNIVLNYVLGKKFGVNGIILATAISLLAIGFGYGTTIVFKYYFKGISPKEYYIKHIFYAVVTIINAFITYWICDKFIPYNRFSIILRGIICLVIPNIFYLGCYYKTNMFMECKKFLYKIVKKDI